MNKDLRVSGSLKNRKKCWDGAQDRDMWIEKIGNSAVSIVQLYKYVSKYKDAVPQSRLVPDGKTSSR